MKEQALIDFLTDHPTLDDWKITENLPNEEVMLIDVPPPWEIFFDGAATKRSAGVRVFFVTYYMDILTYTFTLSEFCSNNIAEYQALILGLKMTVDIEMSGIRV